MKPPPVSQFLRLVVAALLATSAFPPCSAQPAPRPPAVQVEAIDRAIPAGAMGLDLPRVPLDPPAPGMAILSGTYGRLGSGWALPVDRGEILEFTLVAPVSEEPESDPATRPLPGSDPLPVGSIAWSDESADGGALEAVERVEWSLSGGALSRSSTGSYRVRAPLTPGVAEFRMKIARRVVAGGKELMSARSREFHLVLLVRDPFEPRGDGMIGGYPIGRYPDPNAPDANDFVRSHVELYRPPAGLFMATARHRALHVSEHFRLGDFMPRIDREREVFYMALSPRLLEFLEAALRDLRGRFPAGRYNPLTVLVGFQTPYQLDLLRARGIPFTAFSRYQYGDAASVLWDADGDGLLDDLNGDGTLDAADATALADALAEVQKGMGKFGGVGVVPVPRIPGLPPSPYVDVDMRGVASRW